MSKRFLVLFLTMSMFVILSCGGGQSNLDDKTIVINAGHQPKTIARV